MRRFVGIKQPRGISRTLIAAGLLSLITTLVVVDPAHAGGRSCSSGNVGYSSRNYFSISYSHHVPPQHDRRDRDYQCGKDDGYRTGHDRGYWDGYYGRCRSSSCTIIPCDRSRWYEQGFRDGYRSGYDCGYQRGVDARMAYYRYRHCR